VSGVGGGIEPGECVCEAGIKPERAHGHHDSRGFSSIFVLITSHLLLQPSQQRVAGKDFRQGVVNHVVPQRSPCSCLARAPLQIIPLRVQGVVQPPDSLNLALTRRQVHPQRPTKPHWPALT
jgi:hypothetical protein